MPDTPRRFWLLRVFSAVTATILSACKAAMDATPDKKRGDEPTVSLSPQPPGVTGPVSGNKGSARSSAATSPRAYREDGATHIYGLNADRIFKGRLPPLLYAIGVLNVQIDAVGRVTRLDWLRAPRHAPEVIAEIERTVKQASPFPAPARLGKVVYTDTWLWHKSGKFQLDTLTEGQD